MQGPTCQSLAAGRIATQPHTRRRVLTRATSFLLGAAAVARGLAAPSAASADSIPPNPSVEPAFTGGVAITDGGSAASQHWFTLGPRQTSLLSFPVPAFRPIASNEGIALDIMPNGAAPVNPREGVAWIDVCDSDVYTGNGAVGTARVGIFPDHVEFGSRGFNGEVGKPVWLGANANGATAPQIRLTPGSPGTVTLGPDGSAVAITGAANVGGPSLGVTALTVRAATAPTFLTVNHGVPGATSGAGIVGRTYVNPTAADQRLGYFLFGGDQAAANSAGMSGWSAESWHTAARLGSYLTLETTPIGATGRRERLRLGSDGVIRLPNSDAAPSAPPPPGTGYLFALNGRLMWQGASGTVTTIAAS